MGVRLPAEYQEVVSLWSDTNQYIDTGIIADNETGFFVDAQKSMNNHTDAVVIGSRENTGNTRCWIDVDHGSYDGRLLIGWNGFTPNRQQVYLSTNRFTVSVNYKNTRKVFVNGAEYALASSQLSETLATQTHSLYLFGANYAGEFSVGFRGRIFACRISKGLLIIADYVPCYRKADNKPGMYDLISQSFLTNQGTGEFQAGADVIDSISPWLVARRRGLMIPKVYGPNLISLSDFTKISGNATWSVDDETGIITVTGSTNYSAASTRYRFVPDNMIIGHTYEMHCKLISATDISGARFAIRGKSGNEDQIAYSVIPTDIGEEASVIFTVDRYMSYFSLFSKWATGGSQTVAYSDVWVKEILR